MAYNCLWLMNRKERSKVKMLCLLCYKGKQRIFPYSLPFCQHMHIDIFSCNPYNKLSSTFEPFSYFLFFLLRKSHLFIGQSPKVTFSLTFNVAYGSSFESGKWNPDDKWIHNILKSQIFQKTGFMPYSLRREWYIFP